MTGTLIATYDAAEGSVEITRWTYDRTAGCDWDESVAVEDVDSLEEATEYVKSLDLTPVGAVDRDGDEFIFRVEE